MLQEESLRESLAVAEMTETSFCKVASHFATGASLGLFLTLAMGGLPLNSGIANGDNSCVRNIHWIIPQIATWID